MPIAKETVRPLHWVAFNESERLIGEAAKIQATGNATNTVFDAKRTIGRSISDDKVKKDAKHHQER